MLVLRITSNDSLHGLESDDGFVMGQISLATMFLVVATGILGVTGALFYLAVRDWLPRRRRALLTGLFGGIVGGGVVIKTDGIDFSLLEPLSLAVVFFIALPAVYGVVMSIVVERRLHDAVTPDGTRWWVVGLVPLVPFAFLGLAGLGVIALLAAAWVVHRAAPGSSLLWRSPIVVWTGRTILLAITLVYLVGLVRDVTEIL